MNTLNQYISWKVEEASNITESIVHQSFRGELLELTYHLYPNDCLFDIEDKSYKIVFHFQKEYFDKYDFDITWQENKYSICCNVQSKLLEIMKNKHVGIAQNIFIESSLLYLLYKIVEQAQHQSPLCFECDFLNKKIELDKFEKAKNYILNNLSNNINIPSIALEVATNQCYLKKGFKELYGKTIFEFVLENRMTKAKHLLQNSDLNISEIALSTGYASTGSFGQAYKNFFGINPSLENKKSTLKIIK